MAIEGVDIGWLGFSTSCSGHLVGRKSSFLPNRRTAATNGRTNVIFMSGISLDAPEASRPATAIGPEKDLYCSLLPASEFWSLEPDEREEEVE